jgi:signal peptidase I
VADEVDGQLRIEGGVRARPFVAVLLGFLAAGLGQLYAGRRARAFVCFGLVRLVTLLAALATLGFPSLLGVWVPMAFALLLSLAIVVDAYRLARLPRPQLESSSRRRWGYLGFILFAWTVSAAVGVGVSASVVEAYRVPSASMLPTLLVGDHAYADRWTYPRSDPELGDVAVYRVARQGNTTFPADTRPDLTTVTHVKRIVGLPGDTIEVRGGVLYRNGQRATGSLESEPPEAGMGAYLMREEQLGERTHRIADDPSRSPPGFGPAVVPPGRYFLMGDNRDHSLDSRSFGTVHRDDVLGPFTVIYWSWAFNGSWAELAHPFRLIELLRSHTRWDRIGRLLR